MKCDELEYEHLGDANRTYPASTLVIRKQFVDGAIDELKAENERLKRELEHVKNGDCINTCDVVEKYRKIPFKDCLNQHFKAVKGKNCNCLFCRNLNRKEA